MLSQSYLQCLFYFMKIIVAKDKCLTVFYVFAKITLLANNFTMIAIFVGWCQPMNTYLGTTKIVQAIQCTNSTTLFLMVMFSQHTYSKLRLSLRNDSSPAVQIMKHYDYTSDILLYIKHSLHMWYGR